MTPIAIPTADNNDAELVAQSLAGDRQAFGRIVARYQALVCALGYSATGSRSRSEDLAQETFLTAWQKLRDLREPGRLNEAAQPCDAWPYSAPPVAGNRRWKSDGVVTCIALVRGRDITQAPLTVAP